MSDPEAGDEAVLPVVHQDQKWLHDYLVQATGRPANFHIQSRTFPQAVKSYAMAPKHMARIGRRKERWAAEAEAHGHVETAHGLYMEAVGAYHHAEHTIHRDTPQKRSYYERMVACFDKVIQYNPTEIERFEVPWEGSSIQCLFHALPGRPKAPTILQMSGMDTAKETTVDPLDSPYHRRGMHHVVMDGPGMGMGLLRGLFLEADNYERAASAVIDHLATRPEVDMDRFGLVGGSPGAYFATRTAAYDSRVKVLATTSGLHAAVKPVFDSVSPRFKWQFMFMTGTKSEEELAQVLEKVTCRGLGQSIQCPTLMIISEYDEFTDLNEAFGVFAELVGPKEFWLLEDEGHHVVHPNGFAQGDHHNSILDWIRDVFQGSLQPDHAKVIRIASSGFGPYEKASQPPSGDDFWY